MQKDTLWWEISAPLVHTLIYWRSRETGANSGVKIILTWHDVLVGIVHWECIFSVRVGGSSGLVMWGRFITGRPEEHREANVAQVCYSCLILPPAVFHLSSTAVAVLLRLYLRLICHRAVLTFTTAFTWQTKKAWSHCPAAENIRWSVGSLGRTGSVTTSAARKHTDGKWADMLL